MKFDLEKITRKSISRVKPYTTARDDFKGDAQTFLDANENPFQTDFNRYPDPRQFKLRSALAKLKQVNLDQIMLGNGSDEVIDLLFRVFCEPGLDNVVIPQPSYGMYKVSAGINNVEVREPTLTADFQIDLHKVKEAVDGNTKIIFLCSPNNPSGNLLLEESLLQLLESFDGMVVIDEAYIDFSNSPGLIKYLNKYQNLFVLQTLSKAWGLAGLRLGIGFASPEVIRLLQKIKPPYNINSLTQKFALDALAKVDKTKEQVTLLITQRNKLAEILATFSFVKKIYPSDANFLLVQFDEAHACYQFLMKKGIIVRDRSSSINCNNCLRISIGTPEENDSLINALKVYSKKY